MRVFVTGGAGFIGGAVLRLLRSRGDEVVAAVRDVGRASRLTTLGVELVADDLSDTGRLTERMRGADAVIHGAGSYRIGIAPAERAAMWDANVGTTERVLDAAVAAGIPRIVYVSTVNVLGNTHETIRDETYRRDLGEGFLSWYDETKYRAHEAAEKWIASGAPIVIVQPSQVYGPNDHTIAGAQVERAYRGKLRYIAFPETGLGWVQVEDLAAGIVAALDRGRIGEAYSLSGECLRLGEAIAIAARVGGRRPPRLHVPTGLLRSVAPLNDRLGGLPGMPANLAETISAGAGVTYWSSHDKATRELGFSPRSLQEGVSDSWGRGRVARTGGSSETEGS